MSETVEKRFLENPIDGKKGEHFVVFIVLLVIAAQDHFMGHQGLEFMWALSVVGFVYSMGLLVKAVQQSKRWWANPSSKYDLRAFDTSMDNTGFGTALAGLCIGLSQLWWWMVFPAVFFLYLRIGNLRKSFLVPTTNPPCRCDHPRTKRFEFGEFGIFCIVLFVISHPAALLVGVPWFVQIGQALPLFLIFAPIIQNVQYDRKRQKWAAQDEAERVKKQRLEWLEQMLKHHTPEIQNRWIAMHEPTEELMMELAIRGLAWLGNEGKDLEKTLEDTTGRLNTALQESSANEQLAEKNGLNAYELDCAYRSFAKIAQQIMQDLFRTNPKKCTGPHLGQLRRRLGEHMLLEAIHVEIDAGDFIQENIDPRALAPSAKAILSTFDGSGSRWHLPDDWQSALEQIVSRAELEKERQERFARGESKPHEMA
ncbi:MAG: hypothetical protein ABIH21_01415 [Patescibacteria group bacterium]